MRLRGAAPLVLASASSARRSLLEAAGLAFEVVPSKLDESAIKRDAAAAGLTAAQTALELARRKAQLVRRDGVLVIGCYQILVCNGAWFDKPINLDAARSQLRHLRGQAHTLETATVVQGGGLELWCHVETPRLTMRGFSDAFLDRYLAEEGDDVLTTVGAYRLEGPGIQLFERIEGDHSTILGLPLLPLLGFLRRLDMIMR